MPLRLPVLVRGINNLSDARYCAGMGADGLVFTLDPALPGAVDRATVQELAGWVAGVELIGEFGSADPAQLLDWATACHLGRVLLHDTPPATAAPPLPFPVLRQTDLATARQAQTDPHLAAELLGAAVSAPPGALLLALPAKLAPTDWPQLAALARQFPLWLGGDFAPDTLVALLEAVQPAGLVLRGGDEIRPGLRDFTELEAVFEALETDA